ncbi:MAG TPA: LytR C-terminal domain-containing protein [Pseudonocardia sp.]|nr:LytR C-terminal domain-containing protein [Pseudonocardia sp.]
MTAPAPSGGPSPLRLAGLALLGVAVVAGIIGLASLLLGGGGDESTSAAPPPSAGASAAPGTPTPSPGTGDGGVPVPSFPTGPSATAPGGAGGSGGAGPGGTGSGADGSGDAGSGSGSAGGGGSGSGSAGGGGSGGDTAGTGGGDRSGGSSTDAVRAPLRVYNNSTIRGLADEGAADFRAAGWTVTEVGNYSDGIIPTSTVYYRAGTAEKAAAETLGREFGLRVEPRFAGIKDANPGVIVILTKDYQRR